MVSRPFVHIDVMIVIIIDKLFVSQNDGLDNELLFVNIELRGVYLSHNMGRIIETRLVMK